MPDANTYEIYRAYVKNVKSFMLTEKELRRTLNDYLKRGKLDSVERLTKLYALLYSTFSESSFMKMLLTPYGLDQSYIDQIINESNIKNKWFKCIDLSFKVNQSSNKNKKGSDIPNKIQKLKRIVDKYIFEPSIIRNKIAHGQIEIALNSNQDRVNLNISQEISELNYIKIYIWFEVHKMLTEIIEDLIESPQNHHYESYHQKIVKLENYINKTQDWTLESKMETPSMSKAKKRT